MQGVDSFQTLPGDPGVMFALRGAGVRCESGTETDWRRIAAADAVRNSGDFSLSFRPVPCVEILPPVPTKTLSQGRLDGSPVPTDVAKGMDGTRMTPVATFDFFEIGECGGRRPIPR